MVTAIHVPDDIELEELEVPLIEQESCMINSLDRILQLL